MLMGGGGERGIRTLDRVSPIHAFQACAFNHSAISPVARRRRTAFSLTNSPAKSARFAPSDKMAAMSRVALGLILGVVIGLISVGIMLPMHLPNRRTAMLASFLNRFALGFLAANVTLPADPVVAGVIVGLLISVPDAIVTKAYLPIILGGAVF